MKRTQISVLLIITFFLITSLCQANLTPILNDKYVVGGLVWRPDSQLVILQDFPSTRLIYFEKGLWKIKKLDKSYLGSDYIWSNKGDKFVFWKDGYIYLGSLTNKPQIIDQATQTAAVWSPNDKLIGYVSNNNIWIISSDLKQKRKVSNNSVEDISDLKWVNESNTIIFTGRNPEIKKRRHTIWEVNINNGNTQVLCKNITDCFLCTLWQNQIIYMDNEAQDFYTLQPNGNILRLTNDGFQKYFVKFDNQGLYYLDAKRIFYNLKNGSLKVLAENVDYVNIAPNGKSVAYSVREELYISNYFNFDATRKQDTAWYEYEPKEVRLTGVLELKHGYGPPNYGEDPANDKKVTYYVLELDSPINVKGDPADELNSETVRNVTEIQLVCDKFQRLREIYKSSSRKIRIKGTLFKSFTGHHYTNVLITVEEIEAVR